MNNTQEKNSLKVAVLVSGSGSNLQVLIDAMRAGELPIDIVGVISNKEDAYAVTRANNAGIDTAVLSHIESHHTDDNSKVGKRMGIKTFERHALTQLQSWQPDLIVLAGFMRVLSSDLINNAPAPMINLHPSLLPKYKGLDTHNRVLDAGDARHGCSVHIVTAELDAGMVLTQAVLDIVTDSQNTADNNQTQTAQHLQSRVQKLEHKILPWTILLIAKGVINLNQLTNASNDEESSQDSSQILPSLPYMLWMDI